MIMEERRKTGDRRVNTPKQWAPFYCTRQITDRRQNRPKEALVGV